MASFTLPKNFLSGSGPEIRKEEVNFKNTSLPEYGGLYTTVLDNAFSKSECDMLIRAVEARTNGTWEQAMVNVGMGEQKLMTNVRKCGRVIWDDQILVEKIWSRVKAVVPEIEDIKEKPEVTGRGPAKRKETWKFSRLNERARFLKYGKGDYFNPHVDGTFKTPDGTEMSLYTLHLYLNEPSPDSETGTLKGGATTFHGDDMYRSFEVDPKIGRVLIFQHRGLLHSGADVTDGIKYTMRTDLMYKKVEE
ncbi:hypothetical protein MMC28_007397 [Mycoblastus sanguinarius]|nr:hypothetical protein [Mycoblastus sanguinarius]